MATVVNITKKALQDLVDQKKTIKEIAEHFSAPQSKIKEGIKHFDIKIPRASKGGVVFNFIDEEATFTMSDTKAPEVDIINDKTEDVLATTEDEILDEVAF